MGLYIKNIKLIKYFIRKAILFKCKILIRVISEYKLQRKSQQVERI
jgi:hypothetical protein